MFEVSVLSTTFSLEGGEVSSPPSDIKAATTSTITRTSSTPFISTVHDSSCSSSNGPSMSTRRNNIKYSASSRAAATSTRFFDLTSLGPSALLLLGSCATSEVRATAAADATGHATSTATSGADEGVSATPSTKGPQHEEWDKFWLKVAITLIFIAYLLLSYKKHMGNTLDANLRQKADAAKPALDAADEERPPKKEFGPPPPDRDVTKEWTFETLRNYDGDKDRMYIAVCGKVFDVQDSDNFRCDFGYGKLWGGRDATYSLAMLSLKPEDAAKLDWKIDDLPDQNKESLKSWLDHFTKKYTVVGTMKEYADWDFTVLDAFAKKTEE
ncbi:unnamed protein product [Amoebophrya sp. A25]|nr:unnamed protein product [Amoebophrya sp. A25]|eukprot:GSA25T00024962001.1